MKKLFTLVVLFVLSTMAYAQISLTSPVGGEVWQSGSTYNITWTCSGCGPSVNIELSTDGGTTWVLIQSGAPNIGSYSWSIPPMFSGVSPRCRVRVTSGMFVDISMQNFQISHPSMTLITPNGGEALIVGQTATISVASTNSFGGSLDYSTDFGATWNFITNLTSGFPGTVNYTWTVPNHNAFNSCLIRFNSGGPYADFSNGYFTIRNDIDVVTPNGGELWPMGSSQTISWTNTSGVSVVTIVYSTDNGSSWSTVDAMVPTTPSGGSYLWNPVPAPASNQCLVMVMDFMFSTVRDTSNAVFTISSGTATVTAPNGGENWYVGSTQNITWNYTGLPSLYDIEYSTNNGSTWSLVATGVSVGSFGGSYGWTIPNTPSTQCLVRVTDMFDPSRTDVSNAVFTIAAPSITVTAPNGAENWLVGSSQNITWTSVGPITSVDIDYSTDNGSTWTSVVINHPNGVGGGSYTWTVPNTPSNQCLIRVKDFMMPAIEDESDAVFTISPNLSPSLTLVAPNGGEVFVAGNTTNISWTFTGGISNIMIEYTNDNGSNWYTIDSSVAVTTSPYSWTVGSNVGTHCKVRISEVGNPSMNDESDDFFTIQLLGIFDEQSELVKIYPNPADDFIQIQRNTNQSSTLELINMRGKIIRKEVITDENFLMNVASLSAGVYAIRLDGKSYIVVKK